MNFPEIHGLWVLELGLRSPTIETRDMVLSGHTVFILYRQWCSRMPLMKPFPLDFPAAQLFSGCFPLGCFPAPGKTSMALYWGHLLLQPFPFHSDSYMHRLDEWVWSWLMLCGFAGPRNVANTLNPFSNCLNAPSPCSQNHPNFCSHLIVFVTLNDSCLLRQSLWWPQMSMSSRFPDSLVVHLGYCKGVLMWDQVTQAPSRPSLQPAHVTLLSFFSAAREAKNRPQTQSSTLTWAIWGFVSAE